MKGDVRIDFGLASHPKTKKLQRRLGPGGPWGLVCLILWVGQNKPDGNLTGMDREDIEIAAGWDGEPGQFAKALIDVRFLDESKSGFSLHDWAQHQPWLSGAVERSEKARKAAITRHHGGKSDARSNEKQQSSNAGSSENSGSSNAGSNAQQAESDATSMLPACYEHATSTTEQCGEHATSMRVVDFSNAPYPSPSPIPTPRAAFGTGKNSNQLATGTRGGES